MHHANVEVLLEYYLFWWEGGWGRGQVFKLKLNLLAHLQVSFCSLQDLFCFLMYFLFVCSYFYLLIKIIIFDNP